MKLVGIVRAAVVAAKQDWTFSLVGVVLAHGGLLWILISRIELPRRTTAQLIRQWVWRSIEVACWVRIILGARRRSVRLVRWSTHVKCCCGVCVM